MGNGKSKDAINENAKAELEGTKVVGEGTGSTGTQVVGEGTQVVTDADSENSQEGVFEPGQEVYMTTTDEKREVFHVVSVEDGVFIIKNAHGELTTTTADKLDHWKDPKMREMFERLNAEPESKMHVTRTWWGKTEIVFDTNYDDEYFGHVSAVKLKFTKKGMDVFVTVDGKETPVQNVSDLMLYNDYVMKAAGQNPSVVIFHRPAKAKMGKHNFIIEVELEAKYYNDVLGLLSNVLLRVHDDTSFIKFECSKEAIKQAKSKKSKPKAMKKSKPQKAIKTPSPQKRTSEARRQRVNNPQPQTTMKISSPQKTMGISKPKTYKRNGKVVNVPPPPARRPVKPKKQKRSVPPPPPLPVQHTAIKKQKRSKAVPPPPPLPVTAQGVVPPAINRRLATDDSMSGDIFTFVCFLPFLLLLALIFKRFSQSCSKNDGENNDDQDAEVNANIV